MRRGSGILSVAAISLAAGAGLAGCSIGYDYPDTPPSRDQVFAAAREVLRQLYPMSSSTEDHAQLYAVTPVGLTGNSKSRKQIAVVVARNFTGAYEPRVSVTQYMEWTPPSISHGDPGADTPARSVMIAPQRWRPIERLPLEEQALYEAIMGKLLPASAASTTGI